MKSILKKCDLLFQINKLIFNDELSYLVVGKSDMRFKRLAEYAII